MNVRRLSGILSWAAAAALLALLWPEIPARSLEYDEIWTQQFYVQQPLGKTLTDLKTPNNQMLHTLCCKGVESLFGESAATLRLTAFLAMAALLVLAGLWGRKRLPDGGALFLVAALGCSGGLVHYAGTARGYTLQAFFALLLLAALLWRPRGGRRTLAVTGAAAALCLTITSGAIFAGALIGSYLLVMIPWNKAWLKNVWRERGLWLWPLLFVLLWYGCFYTQLRSAQQFGNALSGIGEWFGFCGNTILGLDLAPFLLVAAAGCCFRGRYRRFTVMTLLAVLFALASAWLTKTGPVRVYLPLVPVAAAGAAAGAANGLARFRLKKYAFPLFLLLSLGCVALREGAAEKWSVPDAGVEATKLIKELPAGVFPVYAPNESLPAFINQPAIRDFCGERLSEPLEKLRFIGTPSGALEPDMTTVDLTNSAIQNGEVLLEKVTPGMVLEGRLLAAVCPPGTAARLPRFSGKPWLRGNLWFGPMGGFTLYLLNDAPDAVMKELPEGVTLYAAILGPLKR